MRESKGAYLNYTYDESKEYIHDVFGIQEESMMVLLDTCFHSTDTVTSGLIKAIEMGLDGSQLMYLATIGYKTIMESMHNKSTIEKIIEELGFVGAIIEKKEVDINALVELCKSLPAEKLKRFLATMPMKLRDIVQAEIDKGKN